MLYSGYGNDQYKALFCSFLIFGQKKALWYEAVVEALWLLTVVAVVTGMRPW